MEGLAQTAGISTSYLSEVERGLKRPSTDVIAKIAGALGMRASELLEHVESEQKLLSMLENDENLYISPDDLLSVRRVLAMALRGEARVGRGAERDALLQALGKAAQQLDESDIRILVDLATRLATKKR